MISLHKIVPSTFSTLIASLALVALGSPREACTGVVVMHSNDILGEIEPCGCRNNPLGGMARKANFLKRTADGDYGSNGTHQKNEVIQLDAGDLLFPSDSMPELLAKQSELQARFLLRSMDQLHHDAVVPGEKDFALGWKTFQSLRKKARLKFIAANLKLAKGGKHPFEPSLILTRKENDGKILRVGIIGLVGENLTWPKELKATPAIAAARAQVSALRGKVDVIIALTHQGLDRDKALAEAVPGIDVILGGHTQSFLQTPLVVNGAHIYQSSFRNQYVGVLPLKKGLTGEGYELVGLDPGFDSPEGHPSESDLLVKQFKEEIAKLNLTEAELEQKSAPNPHSEVKYQTWARCSQCHLKQFDFWRKTPHAHALEPLIKANQVANKECLSCHTVGLGEEGGFRNIATLAEIRTGEDTPAQPMATSDLATFIKEVNDAKDINAPVSLTPLDKPLPLRQALNRLDRAWTPVQCENCHMAGGEHPFNPEFKKAVAINRCVTCHNAERAPSWYTKDGKLDEKIAAEKRASMTCPAGGDIPPSD